MRSLRTRFLVALAAGTLAFGAAPVAAQAWHYAAFQPADAVPSEFNFIIAGFGGDYEESIVAQYRWPGSKRWEFWADIGVATPTDNTLFLAGISGGYALLEPTADRPIDVMGTLGIYGAFGSDGSLIRIPIGINVGHTWILDNKHALSVNGFPRLSVDICASSCGGDDTNANLNFDAGVGYEFTKALIGRAAFTFGAVGAGSSDVGFGISLAFRTK